MSDTMLNKIIRFLAQEAKDSDIKQVLEWRADNTEEFEKIKSIYDNTPFTQKVFDSKKRKKLIFEKIQAESQKSGQRTITLNYWLKVAAIFIGLIAISTTVYLYNNSLYYEYSNMLDEVIEIDLPDGSIINLDKNSTISYKRSWLKQFTRDIDLSGRAYFQIKTNMSRKFCVKTTSSEIEVLGTKFTVSDNYNKTQVVLNEGRVRVSSKNIEQAIILSNNGEQLIISSAGIIKHGIVNQNLYFSWLEEKLNFNNCKVSETLDFLSDSYNLNLIMKDEVASEKHLFGSAPSDSPELILEAIAKITNKKINKEEQTFILD